MRILKNLFLLLGVWLCAGSLNANHILGGNITWECLGGNQYQITLTIYKDCYGATAATPDETIFFFPSICGNALTLPFSADAPFVSEVEISDLCASEIINSSCNGGLSPGTVQLTYTVTVTLDPTCVWNVAWNAGDWNYFVNLDNALLPNAYFETVIYPGQGCNDSGTVTSLGVPYFCIGDPVAYDIEFSNPGAYNIVYSITGILADFGATALYEPGYSAASPIPGIAIDPVTGVVSFTAPFAFGNYVVGIQIDMYDGLGNLVGSVLESMAFIIQICIPTTTNFTAPGVVAANNDVNIISGTELTVCAGDSLCFDVEATNANILRAITFSSDFITFFPSGTFVQNGINPATGSSCVETDATMIGDYLITYEATDDACFMPGFDQLQVIVHVLPNIEVSILSALICIDDVLSVTASGDSQFQWNVVSGDADPDFSCMNCGNQTLSPDQNTVIEIIGLNATNACNYRDTLVVDVSLSALTGLVSNETCNGNDGSIDLEVLSGSGNYSYVWDIPFFGEDPMGLQGGTFNVTISDNLVPGCSVDTTFTLTSDPPPSGSISGNTTICQGQSADILFDLNGTGPFIINMTPAGPPTAVDGDLFGVTPLVTTTYTLNNFSDSNVPSCTYSLASSVTITVLPLVSASFLPAGPICDGDDVNLVFDFTSAGTFDVNYSVAGIAQPEISATDGTVLNFSPTITTTYTVTSVEYQTVPVCINNINAATTVIVNELPTAALSGSGSICAGENLDLTIDLTGTGPWQVSYTANGIAQPILNIPATPFNWNITPASTTEYCLINVSDNGVNCSDLINSCQTVTVNPVAAATLGFDTILCEGTNTNLIVDLTSIPGVFNVVIDVTDGQGTSSVNLDNLTDPFLYNVSPDEDTQYTLVSVEYAANIGNCLSSPGDIANITIVDSPSAVFIDTLCSPNMLPYMVVFQITGGDLASYSITPANTPDGILIGNNYFSGMIPYGEGETWTITDANNCNPFQLSLDPYDCPVITNSGTMLGDTIAICGNNPFAATYNNDGVFDGFDDQLMFVMHDSPTSVLGFIYGIDCNDTGFNDGDTPLVFGNGAGQIQYGVVYYVSAVVGDDDGSGDCVNLNANSVSISFGQPVIFFEDPTANMSGGGTECAGNSVDVEVDFTTGQAPWTFSYDIDGVVQPSITTSDNPLILSIISSGLFTLLSVNSLGCAGIAGGSANVIIEPLPSAAIAGNGEVCFGQTFDFNVLLSGTPNWSIDLTYDDGINPPVTSTTGGIIASPYTFTAAAGGTYSITSVTDNTGCTNTADSAPVMLTVNALPTAAFAFGDTSFCSGSTIDLDLNLTGEADWDISYSLDGGAAQFWNAISTPFSASVSAGGTYTINTITDNNGCIGTSNSDIEVTEIAIPVVDAGSDLEACSGEDVLIGTANIPGQTYSWLPINGLDDNAIAQPTVNFLNPGPGDMLQVLSVTSSIAQCELSDDMLLTIHPLPIANAGINDTICYGDTYQLMASGGTSYLWADNGLFLDPLTSNSPEVNPLVSTEFLVNVFNVFLCSSQDSVLIVVPDEFLVVEDFTASVCFDVCDGSIALTPQGGFPPYDYQWQNGLPDDSLQIDLCAGNYSYGVMDNFGCQLLGGVQIQEFPDYFIDNVLITPSSCYGTSTGQIEVIEPLAVDYLLEETQEENQTGIFNDLVAGSYSIIVTDANGCMADTLVGFGSVSGIVSIEPGFNDSLVCYQSVVDFFAEAEGGSGGFTYNWYSCSEAIAGCFLGAGDPLSFTVLQDTTLYVVALDAIGCPSDTIPMSVYFNTDIVLNIGPDDILYICEGQCAELETAPLGGNGNIEVTWFDITNPLNVMELNTAYTSIQCPMDTALYMASGTDGCSPPVTDTILVIVWPTPEAIIEADIYSGCYPTTINFYNLSDPDTYVNCFWELGTEDTLAACTDFEFTYSSAGTYFPTLTVTSEFGCSDTDSLDVPLEIHGYPYAWFSWEPVPVTVLENEVQFLNYSQGEVSWEWNFAGLGDSDDENPSFVFPSIDLLNFEICLEVVNEFGCIDNVCRDFEMGSILLVYVPNAFTPDGDGLNDFFLPSVRGVDPEKYNFMVFDRWGNKLFSTSDPNEPWQGNVHGGDHYAQNDVYVWRIELHDLNSADERVYMGHVTIVR